MLDAFIIQRIREGLEDREPSTLPLRIEIPPAISPPREVPPPFPEEPAPPDEPRGGYEIIDDSRDS